MHANTNALFFAAYQAKLTKMFLKSRIGIRENPSKVVRNATFVAHQDQNFWNGSPPSPDPPSTVYTFSLGARVSPACSSNPGGAAPHSRELACGARRRYGRCQRHAFRRSRLVFGGGQPLNKNQRDVCSRSSCNKCLQKTHALWLYAINAMEYRSCTSRSAQRDDTYTLLRGTTRGDLHGAKI